MRGARLSAGVAAVALGTLAVLPAPVAQAAPAKGKCENPLESTGYQKSALPKQLWGQERMNFTEAWELSRGKGVKIAIVDSGVDVNHPQLRGRVAAYDVTGTGLTDCVGHGTHLAGIIGAKDLRRQGIPLVGVAPEAQLISVKAATGGQVSDPGWFPKAIRKATDLGAKVINLSVQSTDYAALRAAVEYAQSRNVLIVAAAGNIREDRSNSQRPAYPASYPGVLAVGALNQDGSLTTFSNRNSTVAVTAPGQQIVSTWPGGAYYVKDGTSQAAPFAAGAAALVRAYHPRWTYQQVKQQIERTADGATTQGTGSGVINIQRAVTTVNVGRQAPATTVPQKVALMRPPKEDRVGRILAFSIAGVTLAAAAGVGVGALVIPAARRRAAR
ncbi:S8 family serine peptidase [Actinomadura kijaniata]|uniref:S8 family serine peptidase n=1 Tax=Actinomadura kijaniata TaxID=46161 RepID=UPI000AB4E323|nr:S8 family serine peptidase [Actinomadura kijaniata]